MATERSWTSAKRINLAYNVEMFSIQRLAPTKIGVTTRLQVSNIQEGAHRAGQLGIPALHPRGRRYGLETNL